MRETKQILMVLHIPALNTEYSTRGLLDKRLPTEDRCLYKGHCKVSITF